MAELAHLRLEQSLSELEEMQRIALFSSDEIREIIKRRKALEYRLRRKSKKKEDFLDYIEYEMNLLSLISKRRERLLCDSKKEEIDFSIARRINRLFKNAISRFPEEEKLCLDQIQFCKQMKWHELINALHTRMLQVHSKTPELWVMAAKWEMEESRSPENARKLFHRALKINPHSGELYREYFRMELMYSDLIRKRRAILEPQNMKEMETDQDDAILSGEVANIAYDEAVKKFDDVDYALSFIQICLEFEFGRRHIEHIYKDVQERFANKEEVLDALAKKPLLFVEEQIKAGKEAGFNKKTTLRMINKEIFDKYEEAVEKCSTEKMWSLYIDFVLNLLNSAKESKKEEFRNNAVTLMERASVYNLLSLSYYSIWSQLLVDGGDEEAALTLSLDAARNSKKVDLWIFCLTRCIHCDAPRDRFCNLLKEAVETVREKDSVELWKLGLDYLSMCDTEKLMEFFELGIVKRKEVSAPLKEMYLEVCALQKGIESARLLYKRFKKMGPLSPALIQKIIRLENGQLNPSIDTIRKYFEDGIRECGNSNVDLWLDYLKLEVNHGDPSAYSTLYWRAKKTLDDDHIPEFNRRIVDFTTGCDLPSGYVVSAQRQEVEVI